MGALTPGATYIYERVAGVVYQRELGSDPSTRLVTGYTYNPYLDSVSLNYELETVWKDIILESRTNQALQEALDRVKILYHLSKEDGKK